MSMILPESLQYVYWLVVFVFYSLLIKITHAVLQGAEAKTAAIVTLILCASGIATYIDKKIFWGRWNIVHVSGKQWKCMQCGETFYNLNHFMREKHKIREVCIENPTDGASPGCGKQISHCNQEHHKQQYCRHCDRYYLVCVEKHDIHTCQRSNPSLAMQSADITSEHIESLQ